MSGVACAAGENAAARPPPPRPVLLARQRGPQHRRHLEAARRTTPARMSRERRNRRAGGCAGASRELSDANGRSMRGQVGHRPSARPAQRPPDRPTVGPTVRPLDRPAAWRPVGGRLPAVCRPLADRLSTAGRPTACQPNRRTRSLGRCLLRNVRLSLEGAGRVPSACVHRAVLCGRRSAPGSGAAWAHRSGASLRRVARACRCVAPLARTTTATDAAGGQCRLHRHLMLMMNRRGERLELAGRLASRRGSPPLWRNGGPSGSAL